MRVVVLGNSGSGKSTLAKWLANQSGAALLDLDTVAWDPKQIAVARPESAAAADVAAFCKSNPQWVAEGCYANLVRTTFEFQPRLLFLNPGEGQCVANCQSRPWEPHKYQSKAEQDARLGFLLSWAREYYTREGEMSLRGHLDCFDSYLGPKQELITMPDLSNLSPEVAAWLS